MANYAIIPYVENPTSGVIAGWLQIGSNMASRNNYICTTYTGMVKCAYYINSNYYYIAVMAYGASISNNLLYTNNYYSDTYHFKLLTFASYYGSNNECAVRDNIGQVTAENLNPLIPVYDSSTAAYDVMYDGIWTDTKYPITYSYTHSTVSGPAEAAIGDTVTVSAVPDVGYGITDASTQILVTNDNVAVPYTWDAQSNHITFTMPQPATNRGGFGSTGQ